MERLSPRTQALRNEIIMFNTLLHFSWKRGTILREIYKYAKYNNHNSGRSRGWKPITRTKNQRETFAIGFSVPTITVWSGSNALWRVGRLRFACHILVPLDDDDDDDCERMISLTMSRRRISLFSFFEAESCGEVRSIKWRIYFLAYWMKTSKGLSLDGRSHRRSGRP